MTENAAVDIGAVLKARREKLGYSLDEVAQRTCIRKVYLESLEHNRFDDLPGQAYVTGFIRNYASCLGIDSNPLLDHLAELPAAAGQPSLKLVPLSRHKSGLARKPAATRGWSAFAFGLLAVLLLGGALYFLPGLFLKKTVVATAPQEEVASVSAPAEAPTEAAQTPPAADPGEPAIPPAASESPAVPVAEGPVAGQGVDGSPGAQAVAEAPAAPSLPPVAAGGSALRMLALAESSLKIYLDERDPHEYKLRQGLDLTWQVRKTVRIELSGPGVARFWLDGQELALENLESFQLQPGSGE